jgi:hypothetical protein
MASKREKRMFILKNLDTHSIKIKYGLLIVSNLQKENKEDASKTTKITDVITLEEYGVSFLDENKKEMKCVATMIDWVNHKKIPNHTDLKCFWCRNIFETCPIGCPIRYVNPIIEKSYISQITKDRYYMRENITRQKVETLSSSVEDGKDIDMQVKKVNESYYLTDGIFCSFNCNLSFILSKNSDPFYKDSYSLLHSLYEEYIGKKMKDCKILPAPDWRLLKEYGGHLSIDDYRRSFNHIEYSELFSISEMRAISKVYKEK